MSGLWCRALTAAAYIVAGLRAKVQQALQPGKAMPSIKGWHAPSHLRIVDAHLIV